MQPLLEQTKDESKKSSRKSISTTASGSAIRARSASNATSVTTTSPTTKRKYRKLADGSRERTGHTRDPSSSEHEHEHGHDGEAHEQSSEEDHGIGDEDDSADEQEEQHDGKAGRTSRQKTGNAQSVNGKARPMSVSCEICKLRKVKCDRGLPSCGWCSRNGHLCEYKERKKPGLRAGFGRELESRLERMEKLLSTHARLLETLENTRPGLSHIQEHPPSQPHHAVTRDRSLSKTESDGVIAGSLLRLAESGHVHHNIQSRTPVLVQEEETTKQDLDMDMQDYTVIDNNQVHEGSGVNTYQTLTSQITSDINLEEPLPPEDLLFALVDLFFQHVNTWFPILDRMSTLEELFPPTSSIPADIVNVHYPYRRKPQRSIQNQILLHALVATSLRFSNDARFQNNEALRKHYHDLAKQKVVLYGMENSTLYALKAMVILAIDVVGQSNGPPGWHILAVVARMVTSLGLNVEPMTITNLLMQQSRENQQKISHPYRPVDITRRSSIDYSTGEGADGSAEPSRRTTPTNNAQKFPATFSRKPNHLRDPVNWHDDESRRRLFWAVYALDRYAAAGTSFDFALADKEIQRLLPSASMTNTEATVTRWFKQPLNGRSSLPLVNNPENMGTFSYYIEILGLLSSVHTFLREAIDITAVGDVEKWQKRYRDLDSRLTSWKYGLPPKYGNMSRIMSSRSSQSTYGAETDAGWIMIHAVYQMTCIRIHSSAAFPAATSPVFQRSYSATQRCLSAVDTISSLNTFVTQNGLLKELGPPYAFCLWVAARVLLICGSTKEHNVEPDLLSFVEALREMGQFWGVAERYSSILKRVVEEQKIVEEDDSESSSVGNSNRGSRGPPRFLEKVSKVDPSNESLKQGRTSKSLAVLRDLQHHAVDIDILISRQPQLLRRKPKPRGIGGNRDHSGSDGLRTVGDITAEGLRPSALSIMTSNDTMEMVSPNNHPTVGTSTTDNEYNDVFDWFNMPRLPANFAATAIQMSTLSDGGNAFVNSQAQNDDGGADVPTTWEQVESVFPGENVGGRGDYGLQSFGGMGTTGVGGGGTGGGGSTIQSNEFHITNFLADINSDWFYSVAP